MIPRENSIFGSVIETLDLLVQPYFGQDLFIRDQTTLHVRQCLLARKGTDTSRVQRILSHEQVECLSPSCQPDAQAHEPGRRLDRVKCISGNISRMQNS